MIGSIGKMIGGINVINESQMAKIGPILNQAVNDPKLKAAMQKGMGGVEGMLQGMIKKNLSGVSEGQMQGMVAAMKVKLAGAAKAAAGGTKSLSAAAEAAASAAGGAAASAGGAASSAAQGAAGAVSKILDAAGTGQKTPISGGGGGGAGLGNLADLQKLMAAQQKVIEQIGAMMQKVNAVNKEIMQKIK